MTRFAMTFTATPSDIDELGHVNNAVWVSWIQEIAVAHWRAVATADQQAAHVWVVARHEVDYRGNIALGERAIAETWVAATPRGARFDRHVRFRDATGRILVEALTRWALLDRATGRPLRVRAEIVAPFANNPGD